MNTNETQAAKAAQEELPLAIAFHGHKCPALALGLRAAHVAMAALGVERARNQELRVVAESGRGHAMGCFLDGVMLATGCTYGKANIEKLNYDKIAFTLVDQRNGRAVRVAARGEFVEKALHSPFVEQRRLGVEPQEIPAEIADTQVERILTMPEEAFLVVGKVHSEPISPREPSFDVERCAACGEVTFVTGLFSRGRDEFVCGRCAGFPL